MRDPIACVLIGDGLFPDCFHRLSARRMSCCSGRRNISEVPELRRCLGKTDVGWGMLLILGQSHECGEPSVCALCLCASLHAAAARETMLTPLARVVVGRVHEQS